MTRSADPLTPTAKARLAGAVLLTFVRVHALLRRRPLPDVVSALGRPGGASWPRVRALRLSRTVDRVLRVGGRRPRCLILALVLYRLIRAQGDEAEVVIGLPLDARDKDAHAWVEVGGVDVGPPPGKGAHQELARYE